MKKNYLLSALAGCLGLLCPNLVQAQAGPADLVPDSLDNRYRAFDFNLTLKNMHLWRGFKVTNGFMTAGDLHYTSRNEKFRTGLWGGAGLTGDYREFDYYASYTTGGWQVTLWDINNFSGRDQARIFSYDRRTTSHFVDLTVAYTFQRLPLHASWSTILLGRDTYTDQQGRMKSAFSNYVQLDYPVWQQRDASLRLLVGGAFAFTRAQNFYSEHPNFTNIGGVFSKTVRLSSYELPVAATAMWNPEKGYGALQVALTVF